MTDFRALCAELLEALENAIRVIYNEDGTKHISTADPVIAKADAALAQPEPQGASETAWALAQLLDGVQRHDLPNMTGLSDSDCDRIWAARWGRPAIEPVPQQGE